MLAVSATLAGAGLGLIARDKHGNLIEVRGIRKNSKREAELEGANANPAGIGYGQKMQGGKELRWSLIAKLSLKESKGDARRSHPQLI